MSRSTRNCKNTVTLGNFLISRRGRIPWELTMTFDIDCWPWQLVIEDLKTQIRNSLVRLVRRSLFSILCNGRPFTYDVKWIVLSRLLCLVYSSLCKSILCFFLLIYFLFFFCKQRNHFVFCFASYRKALTYTAMHLENRQVNWRRVLKTPHVSQLLMRSPEVCFRYSSEAVTLARSRPSRMFLIHQVVADL